MGRRVSRVVVDGEVCISSGACVAAAPALFRFDRTGGGEVAVLVPGAPLPADDVLVDLARGCPSGALRVFDGDEEIDVF
jgi:ferredoxin